MRTSRRQFIKIVGAGAGGAAVAVGAARAWPQLTDGDPHDPDTDGDRVVPTVCNICHWGCGVMAHVRRGRVTKIVGNPLDPASQGRICPRGAGGIGNLYDPDRLKQPLIRVSRRGEDRFEAVTWDQALNRVGEGMLSIRQKYGPDAFALFFHQFIRVFDDMIHAYGSSTTSNTGESQCLGARDAAFELTFGHSIGEGVELVDFENTRCLTLLGAHVGENMHQSQVRGMANARARGAKIIVVDPRFSVAAGKADYYLPIKPGTDIALLLAWMHVIIQERLYDAAYLAKHALGFEELKQHVSDKTPEWAATITELSPDLIRVTAREIGKARPASLVSPGRRQIGFNDPTQRARGIAILAALLGSYGARGGYVQEPEARRNIKIFTKRPYQGPRAPRSKKRFPLLPPGMPGKSFGWPFHDYSVNCTLREATISGDVRGWMVYGTNVAIVLPDMRRTEQAFRALDFLVVVDTMPSETCGWADVVLPECTYLERHEIFPLPTGPYLRLRQPAVPPMYDSRPGWWIAREIGRRVVAEDYFPWRDAEELNRLLVTKRGVDYEELKAKGAVATKPAKKPLRFNTPSKKIELYSPQMKAHGLDPLPVFRPPEEVPAGMFRVLQGRSPLHTFSRTVNNRLLSQCVAENEVWVNTRAAARLTVFKDRPLTSGDLVVLVNQDGVRSNPVKAFVTERIREDCVFLAWGFGSTTRGLHQAFGKGASASELCTRYKIDPVMGAGAVGDNFVRIIPPSARS